MEGNQAIYDKDGKVTDTTDANMIHVKANNIHYVIEARYKQWIILTNNANQKLQTAKHETSMLSKQSKTKEATIKQGDETIKKLKNQLKLASDETESKRTLLKEKDKELNQVKSETKGFNQ